MPTVDNNSIFSVYSSSIPTVLRKAQVFLEIHSIMVVRGISLGKQCIFNFRKRKYFTAFILFACCRESLPQLTPTVGEGIISFLIQELVF